MGSRLRLFPPVFLLPITADVYSGANFRYGSAFHETWSMPQNIHHKSNSFSSFTQSHSSPRAKKLQISRAGWFLGLGGEKKQVLPDIVKAGDPVLHEPAEELLPEEIGSERVQKIIDDMINSMRKAPGVGLAAPQIGIPLEIIVLEDTEEYISYVSKKSSKGTRSTTI